MEKAAASQRPVELVTVVTFNVLAPCYNAKEGGRHAATNLINSRQWQERHRAKVMRDTLARQAADVICLQEYWFAPAFLSLYETEMARLGYQGVTLRRTGRKEDGVATFVCTERCDIVASHEVRFSDAGDRVALVVLLRSRKTGALFAVANTHLTFPHNEFDLRMRKQQTAKVLKAVELYLQKNQLAIPVIVAGDFNGTSDDAVYAMMEGAGYVSSFKACNQREVGVTHHNHLDEDVGVDFIFVRNFSPEDIAKEVVQDETDTQEFGFLSKKWVMEHRASIPSVTDAAGDGPQQRWALEVVQSWAHPAREPDTAWLDSFGDTSDHRPIVSRFKLLPPRKGRKWIDPKNSTKFQLVHRSYEDPRYGDSQATVRILAPIENPNIARKRLPDAYYEQQEKIIELVEGFNQAATGGDGEDADEERLMASKQQTGRRVHGEEHDDDEDSDDDGYYDEEDEDEDDDEGHDGAAHGHGDDEEDADRFADADEDEDDDLPPLEEDERKQAPAQKSAAVKDVKGKAKAKPKGKAGASAQEFELGEYGFDSNYNYAQHFKPMGVSGGVFMEAPVPKGAPKKGQKPAFALREDEEKEMMGKILTTDIVDFLDDADIPDEIPDDVLAALNDPEAFESLTDDFIVAAGDEGADDDEDQGAGKRGKRRPSRKVHFDDEDDGEYGEEDYDEDEDDEDLDALLAGLKANPEGNKRRERNEHEQIFDARFERALAEFDDDEIGELEQEAEEIKGMTTMDQLGPVLKEFISSRRRVKGIIGKKATGDDDTKSVSGASQRSQAGDRSRASQAGDAQGEESEGEEEDDGRDDEFVFVEAEEPRDQWDCESITTTYTNTENHPTLIDDGPLVSRRRPPIVLSKKTGIPLGVLPTTQPKVKHTEEQPAVNLGQARKKEETKEEKRARKQQIKEARKANRERKKEIKGAFKEEELRQLNMQAKGQGQRVIRLK